MARRKPQPHDPTVYVPKHNGTTNQDFHRTTRKRGDDTKLDTPASLDDVKIAEWIRKRTDKDL